ncbi:MAG: class I SAM-dependent methyltransferase [Candidatus Hydrogenedentes bacterium]|nr:class I SAM-dependent methyltransferase [Candidatus Hydrogenedentota bacterium]
MNALFPFNGLMHLAGDQLLPAMNCCPLCRGQKRRLAAWVQRNPEVSLLQCAHCRAASVSRMPSQDALAALYRDFYDGEAHSDTASHITFGDVNRFGNHLIRHFAPLANRETLRILDFGGGDGTVALNVAEKFSGLGVENIAVCIVDYHEEPAKSSDSRIEVTRADTLIEVEAFFFDIVIASGVIEHVPNPLETLSALLARLKKSGYFYARTPHVLPYMRLSGKNAVPWFFPFPAHLHDLGQYFWEYCFAHLLPESGCHIVRSRPAIVQSSFGENWKVALASHLAKAPWHVLGKYYPYVGGWEVLARKGEGLCVPNEKTRKSSGGEG